MAINLGDARQSAQLPRWLETVHVAKPPTGETERDPVNNEKDPVNHGMGPVNYENVVTTKKKAENFSPQPYRLDSDHPRIWPDTRPQ